MPTVLEAAGLQIPDGLDGKSLWPAIEGRAEGTQTRIFLSECAWQASRGVRTKDYKFIKTIDSGPFHRPYRELYDLRTDPEETNNLAEELPWTADAFEQEIADWVKELRCNGDDPMQDVLRSEGLPFKRRIEQILNQVGLTWDAWILNPSRERFDELFARSVRHAPPH